MKWIQLVVTLIGLMVCGITYSQSDVQELSNKAMPGLQLMFVGDERHSEKVKKAVEVGGGEYFFAKAD